MNSPYLPDLLSTLLGTSITVFCLLSWGQITLRLIDSPRAPIQINHAWIGLTSLISLISLIQLVAPIEWKMSLAIVVIAIANAYLYEKASWWHFFSSIRHSCIGHPFISIISLWGILALSSGALLAPGNYDSGLYHFTSIAWLNQHPITLGLGNLHGRLAFNQSYFPFVALLNVYPLWNKGYTIAGPLFIYLGFASIIFSGLKKIYLGSYLQAALLVLLALLCTDISAPTPDLAINVLQIGIFIQLLTILCQKEVYETKVPASLVALACQCFLISSMKLSGAAFGLSALALALLTHGHYCKIYIRQFSKLIYLLITFSLIHVVRSYLLSGVPFYPMSLGALSWADWSIPITTIQTELNWTYSWARRPGYDVSEVLGSWSWFKPWLKALPFSVLICAFITSICLPWYLLLRKKKLSNSSYAGRQFSKKAGAIFIPLLIATLFWFTTAPDIRFLGVIHQVLAVFSIWLVLAFIKLIPLGIPSNSSEYQVNTKKQHASILGYGFVCAIIILISLQIIRGKIFTGEEPLPVAELQTRSTLSGLIVYSPTSGEQCGIARLPCTPYFNSALKEYRLNNWWLMYSAK